MRKNNSFYIRFLIISQAILIVLTLISLLIVVDIINKNYIETTVTLTDSNTKETLRNSVNNEIIRMQNEYDNRKTKEINEANLIYNMVSTSDSVDNNYIIDNINTTLNSSSIASALIVLVTDDTSKITYSTNLDDYNTGETVDASDLIFFSINTVYSKDIVKNGSKFYFFVRTADFNLTVKESIKRRINEMDFSTNQYIWVNEVLDWSGGDDYAIRYIHPNLTETQGILLTTNEVDAVGNLPYLVELNQIKDQGYVSQTYYFKNLQDNEIVEKYEYAKLFSPFNWIVCTGMPLGDIYANNVDLEETNATTITKIITMFIIIVVILYIINVALFYYMQKKYMDKINLYVRNKTEKDFLTGALTRNASKPFFESFNELLPTLENPLLFILIEIDGFKNINDNYGHQVGDVAISELSSTILNSINYEDKLFRWNDEQFLLILRNVTPENEVMYMDKLKTKVSNIRYEAANEEFEVMITVGKAYLNKYTSELDIKNTIKEADDNLFISKNNKL